MIQGIVKRLFRKGIAKWIIPDVKFSYSQFGEDLIIAYLLYLNKIDKPSYLDIGANHPRFISNTYYFYEHGGTGVCIEPNPVLCKELRSLRGRDKVINAGIGLSEVKEADFYLFPYKAHGLSTFSEKEAKHWGEVGMKGLGKIPYEKVIKVPLIPANKVLQDHFTTSPDILSIDVEGLDYEILQSIDYSKWKPRIICAETLSYDAEQRGFKTTDVTDLLMTKGYVVYADTRVNTIYCLKEML